MNTIILSGNLTRDPETQALANGTTLCKFTLAVNRPYNKDTTDFFDCVCFNKTAEVVRTHLSKGNKVSVVGYVQTREYETAERQKRKTIDFIINEVEFLEKKKEALKENQMICLDIDEEDLPF